MNIATLKVFMDIKKLNASQLAKATGLSRQAISKWFVSAKNSNKRFVNADWTSVLKIANALGVNPDKLAHDPFSKLTLQEKKRYETLLLWDHLYDTLENFIVALVKKNKRAIARYVQIFGILNAQKIWGKWIYSEFPNYAKYIHPARRKELELLCQNLKMMNLI